MILKWKIIILLVLHIVGIVGFSISKLIPIFQNIVPFHLLVITVVLCWDSKFTRNFFLFALISFCVGFGAEVIGINTHLLFGFYNYSPILGIQVLKTPLIIGILWFSTVYASNQIATKLFPYMQWLAIIAAALLMVLFDFMIEPFATHYNLWTWKNGIIPAYNYQSWFLVALMLSYIYQKLLKETQNEVAPYFLFIQILFFLILSFIQNINLFMLQFKSI